jgi:antitoxin ParD1/3/4
MWEGGTQPMTTMNISLPENLKEFIDFQVQMGGYSTSSEYIRELIRQDQQRKLEQRLSMLLLEGLESGSPLTADAAYWDAKKRSLAGES